jgi:hypothetical protein
MQQDSIKSILVINDYLTLCKRRDPKCIRAALTRKYMTFKVNKIINSKRIKKQSLLYFFASLFFIR